MPGESRGHCRREALAERGLEADSPDTRAGGRCPEGAQQMECPECSRNQVNSNGLLSDIRQNELVKPSRSFQHGDCFYCLDPFLHDFHCDKVYLA